MSTRPGFCARAGNLRPHPVSWLPSVGPSDELLLGTGECPDVRGVQFEGGDVYRQVDLDPRLAQPDKGAVQSEVGGPAVGQVEGV
ncbi:hypothetical protein GCM10008024_14690 [Allgaiera indica]|uniref:Uncharacterized protein n=1 Tax=Allgaiera indica TaxID=765699 RepID=A0AAN4ZZC8_9RHOB|nr:hypothetical protein GCM10008024_14690 [Allgaiera indica]